jgi:hypothetical protein
VIWSAGGNAKVSNSVFDNNYAGLFAGVMELQEGSHTITNNTFTNNRARINSAAFRIINFAPLALADSVVTGNTFKNNHLQGSYGPGFRYQVGGAVLVEGYANASGNAKVIFIDNLFEDNSALGIGGGLCIANANAEVKRNTFKNNVTENAEGGGLSVITVPLEFRGGVFAPTVVIKGEYFRWE